MAGVSGFLHASRARRESQKDLLAAELRSMTGREIRVSDDVHAATYTVLGVAVWHDGTVELRVASKGAPKSMSDLVNILFQGASNAEDR